MKTLIRWSIFYQCFDIKMVAQIESWIKLYYFLAVTLHDIVHTDRALTLVFEYLERDLKQYMDDCGGILSMNNVKVNYVSLIFE